MTMTMNTGDVTRRLGVPITAMLLKALGFKPVGKDKRAELWDQAEYPAMCDKLADYFRERKSVPMQPKPTAAPKPSAPPTSSVTPPPAVDDDDPDAL